MQNKLVINIEGFEYQDLYNPHKLKELTDIFYNKLRNDDPELYSRFADYANSKGVGTSPEATSEILVKTAPHLSKFITDMFYLQDEHGKQKSIVESENVVFAFKRDFVQRRALKKHKSHEHIDTRTLENEIKNLRENIYKQEFDNFDAELATARISMRLLSNEGNLNDEEKKHLEALEAWVALHHHKHFAETKDWVSLKTPHHINYEHLVHTQKPTELAHSAFAGVEATLRLRDGFALTDERYNVREVMNEVEYCIYCHERDKDSCSKGLREKDGTPKRNPLGIKLEGCPLDEKISEAHYLKHCGDGLAGLCVIMIDNPMCPGTGHRICNDCMKACIYQKQEPVNIPQIETSMLTEILNYPFGFEIYSLLTRWNPLNIKRPYALPYNGKKVLVVGLGPAGYTLSHYLINEGFGVVGIDGLKIEPLPEKLLTEPIEKYSEIYEGLDNRILLGFGGVSEYGITVRWDKNFLKVIYIALARRSKFAIYGGVRFGGTISIDDAWAMGFDHIAIATGAGKPTIVPMKNGLLRGVRQASDFLMALQLTGAYKPSALANLQLRLPAIVIGGGLTGIDTATEAMAYYPIQVERVLNRSEELIATLGEENYFAKFSEEEKEILNEFIAHGKAIRQERETAEAENRKPDFIKLIRSWGGVSLVYRKSMQDSPAYRLNHEEIIKALEEGIYFVENMSPTEAVADKYGAISNLIFEKQFLNDEGKWRSSGEFVTLEAKSVMIAAGTSPNTIIEKETPGAFVYDQWNQYFAPHKAEQTHA